MCFCNAMTAVRREIHLYDPTITITLLASLSVLLEEGFNSRFPFLDSHSLSRATLGL